MLCIRVRGRQVGFLSEPVPEYGAALAAAAGVRRVVARNPGPLTYHGTNTWLVESGDGTVVIDPGPDDPAHLAAVARHAGRVALILLTHAHPDHAAGVSAIRAATGAAVAGWPAPWEAAIAIDRALGDGEQVAGLMVLHTPGHASDHLCFAHDAGLFSGDHVMGWSTSVVAPPDGDMAAYVASLRRLLGRGDAAYFCGHGPVVTAPEPLVRGMLSHRAAREAAVLAATRGGARPAAIVAALYAGLDTRLRRAAEASVRAHLAKLVDEGRVAVADDVFRAAAGVAPAGERGDGQATN